MVAFKTVGRVGDEGLGDKGGGGDRGASGVLLTSVPALSPSISSACSS